MARVDILGISHEIALRWMSQDLINAKSQDLTDAKSTMVQIMACCHQAPIHYLS